MDVSVVVRCMVCSRGGAARIVLIAAAGPGVHEPGNGGGQRLVAPDVHRAEPVAQREVALQHGGGLVRYAFWAVWQPCAGGELFE